MALGSGYPLYGGAKPKPAPVKPKPPKPAPPSRRPRTPPRPGRPGPGRPFSPGPRKAPKPPLRPPPPPRLPRGPTRPHWFDPFFEPRKPGLKRIPRQTPLPRPMRRWNPFRLPSPLTPFFDPWTDIPAFFIPGQDETFNFPPGWKLIEECPRNPLYALGHTFSYGRSLCSAGPWPNSCLTLQASGPPGSIGGTKTCSNVNPSISSVNIRISDVREISPGQYRAHYRWNYRWCCGENGNAQPGGLPLTNPETYYQPPGAVIIPPGAPDPYAEAPPGGAQPFPMPIPHGDPYPNPNEWIPGAPGWVTPPAIDPEPFIWVDPIGDPDVAPGPSPDKGGDDGPSPAPFPFPNRNPDVNPRPDPVHLPSELPSVGATTSVSPRGRVRSRANTRPHQRRPPRRREKEAKRRAGRIFLAVQEAIGQMTEGADLIDVTFKSIPCAHKRAGGVVGVKGIRAFEKAEFIAKYHVLIDGKEFQRNYLKNQFEDMWYGLTSPEKAYYQQMFRNTGVSAGGKFAMQNAREGIERKLKERAGYKTSDPVIDAFNAWLDEIYGPVPKAFKC